MYLLILSIILYIIIILYAKRYDNYYFMPAVVFASILVMSQGVYYYLYSYPIEGYLKIGNQDFVYNPMVYAIHQVHMIVCFLSLINVNASKQTTKSTFVNDIQERFSAIRLTKTTVLSYYFFFLLIGIVTFVHFREIDFSLFLENDEYHLLKKADALGLSTPARVIHYAAGMIAIVILMLAILMFKSRLYVLGLFLLPFFLYFLSLKVAANSRWGPLILISAIPLLYKRKSILSVVSIFFTSTIAFSLYLGALYGRNATGGQGLLPVFSNIKSGVENFAYFVPKLLATSFASASNLSLALAKFSIQEVAIETKYKILAFSPLLSSMDGLTKEMIQNNRLAIHSYAPVNFMTELYFFGLPYAIFFFTLLFLAMRYSNKIVVKYGILGVISSATFYLFFFKMQQYPIRNNFRFIVIAIVLTYLLDRYMKSKQSVV